MLMRRCEQNIQDLWDMVKYKNLGIMNTEEFHTKVIENIFKKRECPNLECQAHPGTGGIQKPKWSIPKKKPLTLYYS